MSELRRGIVRITSSYGRLGVSLLAGIIQTRLMLGWLGADAYGLVAFVGSSVGLALLIDDVLRASMIRELSTAHHSDLDGTQGRFAAAINAGGLIALAGTVGTALLFGILILLVPLFDIPRELHDAGRWLIAAEGLHACVLVATSPIYNMYMVTERFVEDNFLTAIRKVSSLVVAWFFIHVWTISDPGRMMVWHGWVSVAINILVMLGASAWIMRQDKRLRPRPSLAEGANVREFLGTFGWNTSMMVAVNCYDRIGQMITNLFFGTVGNTIFGVGYQLAAYVRMVSLGVNFGSDAVAARLSSKDEAERREALITFTTTMTRLHGFSAFPAAAILSCLTVPIMTLWVGDRLKDPEHLTAAIVTAQILMLPVTVRAVTDCWTRILYGAGYIRIYAPLLLIGGLVNPIVAIILLYTLRDPYRQYSAAISFAAIMTLFHFILLPAWASKCLNCQYRTLLLPVIRPAIAAAIPTPILLWGYDYALNFVHGNSPVAMIIVAAAYGLFYMLLSILFVLKPDEKKRFTGMIARRLKIKTQD
jgi:hypothetical protein